MRFLLIMNPGSHAGRGRARWQRWEDGLRRAGVPYAAVRTEGRGHAFLLAREAAEADAVVAVGGDGTINEALDGVLQSGRPDLRFGVLYAGTSPDFCRFHGIPVEPDAALAALLSGRERRVDAARIRYRTARGRDRTGHFGCSCNVGLGAAIARQANRLRPLVGDAWGTGTAVVQAFLACRPADLEIELDGHRLLLPAVNNLTVLKNPYIASGLRLNVDVAPDDGRLWLAAIHGKGRLGLCDIVPGFYTGRAAGRPDLFLRPCARVSIRAAGPVEVEFDGDPRGRLPVSIEVLPGALRLIGCRGAAPG